MPEPGPTDAIVRTTTAMVCTSDTHTVEGAIGERHDLTLGHEAVGVIHRLGEAVEGFEEGQRVAVNAITPCWHCANCQRGYPSQCGEMLGGWKFANVKDGNLAEYFHVNDAEANLAPIPDALTDEQAVYCCDMISTGFAAAEKAEIPIGGSVAVFAQGPIGLMATRGARLLGAGFVIAVESVEGVDAAIEALGAQPTFEACVKVTRPGGTISNVGYHGEGEHVGIPREAWGVGMSDQRIHTSLCPGGHERMARLMRLIEAGRVDPLPMTTHRFDFDDVVRAFEMMDAKEDGVIKPLITFS